MSEEKLDNLQNAEGNDSTQQNIEVNNEVENKNDTTEVSVENETTEENGDKSTTEVEKSEKVEIPLNDYSKMDAEKLYDEAEMLIKSYQVQLIKTHVEKIREQFYSLVNLDKKDKEEAFIAEGGNVIDFRYESYIKKQFAALYSDYRAKKDAFQKNLEEQQLKNLKFRQDLINELKELINKEETMSETYKEFTEIRDKWANAGHVPKTESNDLWRTYHHHVEMFYDFLRLNNEMRDLDFKHNYDKKAKLILAAKNLANEPSIKIAFDELQLLHKIWKEETGPVAKELRDVIWEEFSDATKVIHDRRHEQLKEQRKIWEENLVKKQAICKNIELVTAEEGFAHAELQDRIKRIDALKGEFQKIGRVANAHNDEIWQQFKDVTRAFNKQKNDFYKGLKDVQTKNLEQKVKLVEVAESLKDSTDWKNTTDKLKKIQADWKKIGHVPRQQSDEIWNRFRGACNYFFDKMTENRKAIDSKFDGNLIAKQEFLVELEKLVFPEDSKEAVALLKEQINKWKSFGPVPRNKKAIENEFSSVIDKFFDKLNLDQNETALIKFKNKIDTLVASDDIIGVRKEGDFVRKKMEEIRKEINLLDNNLGFFNVSPDSPLVKDVHRKIERNKENLNLWKLKNDYLKTI
ncbi:MAG: DUF349 domain-containing protein [Ichthyobacteriaceae bacterium]|nr:DUF349 domain-containing protein [Ichthyobacteriaceae bacterium]